MQKVFFFILTLFLSCTALCQPAKPTTIVVIGNIHDSVPNYHPQILYTILDAIKPDLILHEVDSSMAKEYFGTVSTHGENEIKASNKYVAKYPATQRGTFDFEGRNEYRKKHGMVPTDNLCIKLIDSLYKSKLLTSSQNSEYELYKSYTSELMKLASLAPSNFNNRNTDSICELRQNAQHLGLMKIINSRDEFKVRFVTKPDGDKISYREGYKLWADFWDTRNKAMAQNILNYAKNYHGKTIVVLTGFLHRYYLLKELSNTNPNSIVIKEFYQ